MHSASSWQGHRLGIGPFYMWLPLSPKPSAHKPKRQPETAQMGAEGAQLQRADSWDEMEGPGAGVLLGIPKECHNQSWCQGALQVATSISLGSRQGKIPTNSHDRTL